MKILQLLNLKKNHISKIITESKGPWTSILTQNYSYAESGKIAQIEEFSSFVGKMVYRYVFTATETGGTKITRYDLRAKEPQNFDIELLEEYDEYHNWQKSISLNSKGEILGVMTREISYYEE